MNLQKPHSSSSSSSSPTFSAPSGASFFDSSGAAGAVFASGASVALSLASRSKLWRGQGAELAVVTPDHAAASSSSARNRRS